MEEIFKDIPGYEGMYQVSNFGNVKSLKWGKERILNSCFDGKGYLHIRLHKNKISKTIKLHKLVAITFLNHKPDGHVMYIDHINNLKTDNRLVNLQIITPRENSNKDRKKGTSKYRGVSWNKRAKKWISKIQINGKNNHLGYFNSELEASEAYKLKLKTVE